jgi:hypothetical protein
MTEWLYDPNGEPWVAAGTNEERADWAEAAVVAFREACSGDLDETALYDLVANMGHLADRLTATLDGFELTFEDMVDTARTHYEAERGEGDGIEQGWRGK